MVVPGNHDGVHRGHRKLVARAREQAGPGVAVRVLTFDPHPAAVLAPERAPTPLTTPARRVQLLRACGADEVLVQPFTRDFARQEPERFLDWLQQQGAVAIVVGDDFRFGKGRAGDIEALRRFGEREGIAVVVVEEVLIDGERVSSSAVRAAVAAGELAHASALLGRLHDVSGEVIEGDRRGRQLGFPTANLAPEPVLLPGDGVYAVVARIHEADAPLLRGVANIGKRPTFDAGPSIEVHLLDFEGDIYGKHLRVGFVERVRAEQKFESVDALKTQIQLDCDHARGTLAGAPQESWAWI